MTAIAHSKTETLFEKFIDATPRESTRYNRLITKTNDSGNVVLIGYGEKVLAEYDESDGEVTIYLGHKKGGNTTITRWLNDLTEVAMSRRDVTLSEASPWFDSPNSGAAQYIGNYISFRGENSKVERDARKEVNDSLKWLDQFL